MTKVCKFGGTSVANAKQIRKVADIVNSDPSRKCIVVSAPAGITDLLYRWVENPNETFYAYNAIREDFLQIAHELKLDPSFIDEIGVELQRIRRHVANKNPRHRDYIVSRGEFLNAQIIARVLGFEFVDAVKLIFFDASGGLKKELTRSAIRQAVGIYKNVIIPGFYGISPSGAVKTFARGGSDITGALVAELAVGVDVYENWTDVEGLYTADPRIVPEAKPVGKVSFWEMRELAYSGAKVLAYDAVLPALEANIPINIKNTNKPEHPGTLVVKNKKQNGNIVTGIAGRKGFSIITVQKFGINEEVGYIHSMAKILKTHGISVEHMPSSIDTLGAVIGNEYLDMDVLYDLKTTLAETWDVSKEDISVDTDIALISVVGENMAHTPGVAGRIFGALGNAKVNVRMINQGSSEINVIIGVKNSDYEKAIKAIYSAFFGEYC